LAISRNRSDASADLALQLPPRRKRSGSAVEINQDVKDDLSLRLRRIEGQIRGIQAMIEESRECRDIVTQIAAASKALDQVGFKMLASGLSSCLEDPKKSAKQGYSISEVEKLFLKLA
jgi:DNA-binding FrmR family transcriptional regulator